MFKKIEVEQVEEEINYINITKYSQNPFCLAENGYTEGELFYIRDELFKNEFPFIVLPEDEKNLKNSSLIMISEEEVNYIKRKGFKILKYHDIGEEPYYLTSDFIDLEKKENKNIRKDVHKFEKKYKYKILTDYPKEKILAFIKDWEEKQENKDEIFYSSLHSAIFCVNNKESIKQAKWIFLEINGKLAGYNISYRANKDLWIGIHQKVDYSYKGIGRFLLHRRAIQFKEVKEFTIGKETIDSGIANFKNSLHPWRKEKRYYCLIGEKEKSEEILE